MRSRSGSCAPARLLVGGDVQADEPELAVAHLAVRLRERRAALAERLDLGAGQHEPGLDAIEQVVLVRAAGSRRSASRALPAMRPIAGRRTAATTAPEPARARPCLRAVDPRPHLDRVAEPERRRRRAGRPARCRARSARSSRPAGGARQVALEDVAEADEEAGADHADDLALERLAPSRARRARARGARRGRSRRRGARARAAARSRAEMRSASVAEVVRRPARRRRRARAAARGGTTRSG